MVNDSDLTRSQQETDDPFPIRSQQETDDPFPTRSQHEAYDPFPACLQHEADGRTYVSESKSSSADKAVGARTLRRCISCTAC